VNFLIQAVFPKDGIPGNPDTRADMRMYAYGSGGRVLRFHDEFSAKPTTGKSLAEFIIWSKTNFPAKKYMLILNGHGRNLGGTMEAKGLPGVLTMSELASALKKSGGIDLLYFESCLMQSVENAYRLRGLVSILAGSETATTQTDHDFFLKALKNAPDSTPVEVGQILTQAMKSRYRLNKYRRRNNRMAADIFALKQHFSIVDTQRMDTLVVAIKTWVDQAILSQDVDSILAARKKTCEIDFAQDEEIDLAVFVKNVARTTKNQALQQACAELLSSIDGVVLADAGQHDRSMGGLSVNMNLRIGKPSSYTQKYYQRKAGAFATESGWVEFLSWLAQ